MDLFIAFLLGSFVGAIVHGHALLKNQPVPKYEIGQCVAFEQSGTKETGVILAIRWGHMKVPQKPWDYQDMFRLETRPMIQYKIDIRHVKFNTDIHFGNSPGQETNKSKYIWVKESEIGVSLEKGAVS